MLSPTAVLQKLSKWLPGPVGRILGEIFAELAMWPITFSAAAPTVASAAGVITIAAPVTFVSGVAAITGLSVPANISSAAGRTSGGAAGGYGGRITIVPTGVFTWTAATNIALAGTAVVGKALDFTYDSVTAKWYPSYIA